jgi:hypothetical protein
MFDRLVKWKLKYTLKKYLFEKPLNFPIDQNYLEKT